MFLLFQVALHILSLQTALFKEWKLHMTAFLLLGGQPGVGGEVGYCNCSFMEAVHSLSVKMESQMGMEE